MWADLGPPARESDAAGLAIRRVTEPAQLADFAVILADGGDPPATVQRFFADAAPLALAADCPARYLVGYRAGRPVGFREYGTFTEHAIGRPSWSWRIDRYCCRPPGAACR